MIRRNVLIFHAGGLGDFVLAWPLGVALGRLYPQSRIIFITQASKGELAARVLRLDWRDAESGWPALYADIGALPPHLRQMLVEAHFVISFVARAGDRFWGNVAAIAPDARQIALTTIPPRGYDRHAIDYLLEQLITAPVIRTAVENILASIAKSGVSRRQPAGPPSVLVHPGAGALAKCWPAEKFLDLIDRLNRRGAGVEILLGEVELERFSHDVLTRFKGAGPVLTPAVYADLYEQLAAAGGFVGNDSGPAHLAAIIGVPTLTLFGPTSPGLWRPLGPRTAVICRVNLSALEPEDVDLGLQQLMAS